MFLSKDIILFISKVLLLCGIGIHFYNLAYIFRSGINTVLCPQSVFEVESFSWTFSR